MSDHVHAILFRTSFGAACVMIDIAVKITRKLDKNEAAELVFKHMPLSKESWFMKHATASKEKKII